MIEQLIIPEMLRSITSTATNLVFSDPFDSNFWQIYEEITPSGKEVEGLINVKPK